MKRYLILITSVVLMHAESEHHQIRIPLRKSRQVILRVTNYNNHDISQINSNTTHMVVPQQTVHQPIHGQVSSWWSSCSRHPWLLAAAGVASIYGVAVLQMWWLSRSIQHTQSWAYWHDDYSLEQLQATSQYQLARELFQEIKVRYLPTSYTALNFLDPLVAFMRDADAQIAQLQSYSVWRNRVEQCHLSVLFPACCTVEHAQMLCQRIEYLKRIAVTWLSEYGLEKKAAVIGVEPA